MIRLPGRKDRHGLCFSFLPDGSTVVQRFYALPEITQLGDHRAQVVHLGPCLALATSCLFWNHPSLSPFQVQLPEIEECRHTDPEALAGPPL